MSGLDAPRTVVVQGLELSLATDWEVAPGWDMPEHQARFGALLRPSSGAGPWATFSVRRLTPVHQGRFDAAGLSGLLALAGWGPPRDVVVAEVDGWSRVVATFAPPHPPPRWLKEWYVTDGERVANCTAVEPTEAQLADCEAMAASVRFVGP